MFRRSGEFIRTHNTIITRYFHLEIELLGADADSIDDEDDDDDSNQLNDKNTLDVAASHGSVLGSTTNSTYNNQSILLHLSSDH